MQRPKPPSLHKVLLRRRAHCDWNERPKLDGGLCAGPRTIGRSTWQSAVWGMQRARPAQPPCAAAARSASSTQADWAVACAQGWRPLGAAPGRVQAGGHRGGGVHTRPARQPRRAACPRCGPSACGLLRTRQRPRHVPEPLQVRGALVLGNEDRGRLSSCTAATEPTCRSSASTKPLFSCAVQLRPRCPPGRFALAPDPHAQMLHVLMPRSCSPGACQPAKPPITKSSR